MTWISSRAIWRPTGATRNRSSNSSRARTSGCTSYVTAALFLVSILLLTTGKTAQELDNNILQIKSIAQKHSCNILRLDYLQEKGLAASLPLAENKVGIERALTTSAAAIFVPFSAQELFQDSAEAIYSGLNAASGNMIYLDRKRLKAPNGLILGTPGSGKSFTTKREIYSVFLATGDDVIICDPESEYAALTERFVGQIRKMWGDIPYIYVQLPEFNARMEEISYDGGKAWIIIAIIAAVAVCAAAAVIIIRKRREN